MSPNIIFENKQMLAIEKPAGMVVNRADTTRSIFTIQDWVQKNVPDQVHDVSGDSNYIVNGFNKSEEFISRSGIVHRLDKETSGIILVAKNVNAFIDLQDQFKSGIVKKSYIALVHGKIAESDGKINAPIGRLPWNRTRFGVLQGGREALTIYKVLEYKIHDAEILTLVEVYPQTGRTHQIRVHFQYINHPIFSDELYAGRKQSRKDRKILPRHFLHASSISFNDPETKETVVLKNKLTPDLANFINSLENFTVA